MRVLIVAGGTGGHFYPGLSVGKLLVSDRHDVCFVVRVHDAVISMLERENFSFFTIYAGGLQRRLSFKNILSFLKLIVGFLQAPFVLMRFRPHVVLAMGGYLSVPVALVAKLFAIPVVLHEQNVRPGLANRLTQGVARFVALGFEESASYFGPKGVFTGNPVRPEFATLPERETALRHWGLSADKKTLLVFGGSLGAHRVNQLVIEAVKQLGQCKDMFQILHFTGTNDEKWVKEEAQRSGVQVVVHAYCHEMALAYAASDFIVCRAGASTVAELLTVRKPALLIPYPYATENHQLANAKILLNKKVGFIMEEKNLDGATLAAFLKDLIMNFSNVEQMAARFQMEPHPTETAAERIKKIVLQFEK